MLDDALINSDEAARRLGIKRSSLYVYVSRGLLCSRRAPDGRHSLFVASEVDRLAAQGAIRSARRPDDQLRRDRPLLPLRSDPQPSSSTAAPSHFASSSTESFEGVLERAWHLPGAPWEPAPIHVERGLGAKEFVVVACVLSGASDPWRGDLSTDAAARAARRLISSVVAAVPSVVAGRSAHERALAAMLSRKLCPLGSSSELGDQFDLSLRLLLAEPHRDADLAVRTAVGAGADLYDAMLAGLGTRGSLLGAREMAMFEMLAAVDEDDIEGSIARFLTTGGRLERFRSRDSHGEALSADLAAAFASVGSPRRRRTVERAREVLARQGLVIDDLSAHLVCWSWTIEMGADGLATLAAIGTVARWSSIFLAERERITGS